MSQNSEKSPSQVCGAQDDPLTIVYFFVYSYQQSKSNQIYNLQLFKTEKQQILTHKMLTTVGHFCLMDDLIVLDIA